MSSKPYLTIAVPVYNEEKTVEKILTKLAVLPIKNYEVVVIDDCSKDKSHELINKFIKKLNKNNFTLIRHDINLGKGAGIKSALKVAKGDYFVVQDADLEYDPKDIVKLITFAEKNNVDAVYGSRFMGTIKNMPKANYIANKFYNILVRVMYGAEITDMHTCYKMVKTKILLNFEMESDGFGYATEMISKLLRSKITIHELPISFDGRNKKQGKKINFIDGIECTYQLLAYRLGLKK